MRGSSCTGRRDRCCGASLELRLATAEQAEDAVSDTMVRAMAAIGRYCESPHRSGGIIGWLVGIERNVIHETYRAGARLRAVPTAHETVAPELADRLVADDEAAGGPARLRATAR